MILHISAGGMGLLSGAAALSARKGERLHRAFGTVFFVSMLTMSAMASFLAIVIPRQIGNLGGGVFTFYLVATGWSVVRREEGTIGPVEVGGFVAALGALAFAFWALAAVMGGAQTHGVPIQALFIFVTVTVMAAALDLKVILRGGVCGRQRVSRHLWRMCLGLFVATGSFFLGKQQDMPAFVRGSPVLILLAVAPLGAMIFWLIRVRLAGRAKRPALAA